MIVEGILLLVGVSVLLRRYAADRLIQSMVVVAVLLLFWIWSPGTLFGYQGQLRTTVYPEEYETLRTEMLSDTTHKKVLALPWHSYIGCRWMGRSTISNPIRGLLAPVAVISADNIEVGQTLYTNSSDPVSRDVEEFLRSHDLSRLATHDITHILLMKQCANSESYDWLEEVDGCAITEDNAQLRVYQCTK